MRMDSDGKIRPKPLPFSKKQLIEYLHSHYTIAQRKYETPCWKWTGGTRERKDSNIVSYGVIGCGKRRVTAHKLSLEIHVGKAPKGKPFGLHRCHYKDCIRPDHLYWGTHEDNMRDKALSGRASRLQGENNPTSKLTNKIVTSIRDAHDSGKGNFTELGAMFGLHKGHIRNIVRRAAWAHIP